MIACPSPAEPGERAGNGSGVEPGGRVIIITLFHLTPYTLHLTPYTLHLTSHTRNKTEFVCINLYLKTAHTDDIL